MVKAASNALGIKTSSDTGVNFNGPIETKSDASAAIGIANRIGIGKVRHIEVNQLWLQDRVSKKEIQITKVGTEENLADALIKAVGMNSINKHIIGIGAEVRNDRHRLAPNLTGADALDYESSEGDPS